MQPYAFLIMLPVSYFSQCVPFASFARLKYIYIYQNVCCNYMHSAITTRRVVLQRSLLTQLYISRLLLTWAETSDCGQMQGCWGRDHMPRKATCAFWQFRCGFAMQLTHYREEEVSRWWEGKGRTNVRLLLHDTRWNLSLSDSARIAADCGDVLFLYYYFFSPPNDPLCVSVPLLHTTMESDTGEMIEEFMESALAQWVCHLSLHYFSPTIGSSFAISVVVRVERVHSVQISKRSLNKLCYFHSNVLVVCSFFNLISFYFWKGLFSILINSINAQVDAKEMTKRPQCPYCCCFVDLSEKQTRHFSFWQLPMSLIGQRVFFLLPLSPLPCPCSVSDLKVTGTDCVTASEGTEPLKPSEDWPPHPHPPLQGKRSTLDGALAWPPLNSFCNITEDIVLSHIGVFTLLLPSSEEWGHRSGSTRCLLLAL